MDYSFFPSQYLHFNRPSNHIPLRPHIIINPVIVLPEKLVAHVTALGLIPQKNEQRSIATVKRLIPIHRVKFAETAIAIITNHVQFVWAKGIPIINFYVLTETEY